MTKPKITLYCLPFAGGNSYSFRPFKEHLPDFIQPVFLEPPGRGLRMRDALLHSVDTVVTDLIQQLNSEPKTPYVLYGHSMGGLLGYELIHRLQADGIELPQHFAVSGCRAPRLIPRPDARHLLSQADFFNMLQALGGLPKELLQNQELMEFFEPLLRADFQVVDTYQYTAKPALTMPVTVLGGKEDKEVSYTDLTTWQEVCAQPIQLDYIAGDHFFIFNQPDQFAQRLAAICQHALSAMQVPCQLAS